MRKRGFLETVHRYRFVIWILILIAAVVAMVLLRDRSLWEIVGHPGTRLTAAIVLLVAFSIKPALLVLPMIFLYVSAGLFFTRGQAIALSYAGLVCMCTTGYLMGRAVGKERLLLLLQQENKAAQLISLITGERDFAACMLSRLFPFPMDIISMFYGAVGMNYFKYLIASLLGASPAMISYIIAGRHIQNPLSVEFLLPFAVSISISFIVLFIYGRIKKMRRSK